MKSFIKEFREFALKSNVMMVAVGVIIGGAFHGIITSFIDNILSPVMGIFVGANFDSLMLNIFGVTVRYGAFFTSVLNFLIIAFVVFMMVKGMNRLMSMNKAEEPKDKENQHLYK